MDVSHACTPNEGSWARTVFASSASETASSAAGVAAVAKRHARKQQGALRIAHDLALGLRRDCLRARDRTLPGPRRDGSPARTRAARALRRGASAPAISARRRRRFSCELAALRASRLVDARGQEVPLGRVQPRRRSLPPTRPPHRVECRGRGRPAPGPRPPRASRRRRAADAGVFRRGPPRATPAESASGG